jgi:WD40 repeat protein
MLVLRSFLFGSFVLIVLYSNSTQARIASALNATPLPDTLYDLPVITAQNARNLSQLASLTVSKADDELWQGQLRWSPDGRILATTGERGVWLFSPYSRDTRPRLLEHPRVCCIRFSQRGDLLASFGDDGITRLWNVITGQRVVSGDPNRMYGTNILSPNFKIWAEFTGSEPQFTINLWETATGKLWTTLHDAAGPIAFSSDSTVLAYGNGFGKAVTIFDLVAGKVRAVLRQDIVGLEVRTLAFSPSGEQLAVGSTGKIIWLWNTETGRLERLLEADQFADGVLDVVYSPSGRLLVSWGRTKMYLWQTSTGKQVASLPGHGFDHVGAVFDPSSTILASWDLQDIEGNRVRLWDVPTGTELLVLRKQWPAQFNPDGTILASYDDQGVVILWGVAEQPHR